MKYFYFFIISLFLLVQNALGQVKISDNNNTTVNPNAILDLESNKLGILPPTVVINDLNSAAPLTAPVSSGMLVYSLGGSVADGYYYWNGVAWNKLITGASIANESIVYLSNPITTALPNLIDATGLAFFAEANKSYYVEFSIIYTTGAANRGITFAVNGPVSPAGLAFQTILNPNATTLNGGSFNTYNTGNNSGSAVTGNNYASISGIFKNGANPGTFILRFAAENTSTATIEAGSFLKYQKLN